MTAFQGQFTPAVVGSTSYGTKGIYAINFDSLAGAFVCELYLLVQNDWPMLMEAAVAARGKVARAFFFAFWLTHLVLVLNVLVAFVIDSFSTQKMKRETLKRVQDVAAESGAAAQHGLGVENWRQLILRSGLDFTAYRIARKAHHFDVYDELYKDEVKGERRVGYRGRGERGGARGCLQVPPAPG
jgi:hypothetical protein